MFVPGAVCGQARVVIVPVVVVVVRADQVAVRGLLVVGDDVFVRQPLEGQTQRRATGRSQASPARLGEGECGCVGSRGRTGPTRPDTAPLQSRTSAQLRSVLCTSDPQL